MWDDVKKARTFSVPGMTPKGKAVLMLLASHKGVDGLCNPSVMTLSAESLFSYRCVKRAVEELKGLGVVSVESHQREGRANSYVLHLEEVCHRDTPQVCQTRAAKVCQARPEGMPNGRAGCATRAPEVRRTLEEDTRRGQFVGKCPPPPTTTPTCDEAMRLCQQFGATPDEARRFYLFNQLRDWVALRRVTLRELAEAWVIQFRRRNPDGWAYEQERRREAYRQAQLQRLQTQIANEERNTTP